MLSLQERQEKIYELAKAHKRIRVREMSRLFDVSEITIRSDIMDLEKVGLLIKTHGGAMLAEEMLGTEIPYVRKSYLNVSQKQAIGAAAAALIRERDVVILDSGSTMLEVAKRIKTRNITVITNDLKVAAALAQKTGIRLFVTGGEVDSSGYTMMGEDCIHYLEKINVNKALLGCDAFDLEKGVSNRTMQESYIKQAMMKASEQKILVFDKSKLGKKVFARVCTVADFDLIVTDELEENERIALRTLGVEYIETADKTL